MDFIAAAGAKNMNQTLAQEPNFHRSDSTEFELILQTDSNADQKKFKQYVSNWSTSDVRAIQASGVQFVISDMRNTYADLDSRTVHVSRRELFDPADDDHSFHMLLNSARLAACADELREANWGAAWGELNAYGIKHTNSYIRPGLNDKELMLFFTQKYLGDDDLIKAMQYRLKCPTLSAIYEQYTNALSRKQRAIAKDAVALTPAIPSLKNASVSQKEAFETSFKKLPESVQSVILRNGISFSVKKEAGSTIGSNNTIAISEDIFPKPGEPPARSLAGTILGYSLASLYGYQDPSDPLFVEATKEDLRRTFKGIHGSNVAVDLFMKAQQARSFQDNLGRILAGTYIDMNDHNRGNEIDALLKSRQKIYEAFIKLAEDQVEPGVIQRKSIFANDIHALDHTSGKNGTKQYIEVSKVRENESRLIHYKDAAATVDNTPFKLQGPLIVTHQTLVLTPHGLVPLAKAVKVPTNNLMNIHYAMAIFESEHCKDEASFTKRLQEERQRFKASKIILRDVVDPTKVIDTDRYFEQFSNGAIQLYASAAEYYAALSSLQDTPLDMEKLKANILKHGTVQNVWVQKKDHNRYTLLWGDNLRRAYEELDNEQVPVLLMNEKPIIKQPPVNYEKIKRFKEEYNKWSDNLRTVTEHAGLIYFYDGAKALSEQKRYVRISNNSRLIDLNPGMDDSITTTFFSILQERTRISGLVLCDINMSYLWEQPGQELKDKMGKLPKSWLLIDDSSDTKIAKDIEVIIMNARQQPDEYRKNLGFTYIADQRTNQIVDEIAEKVRTGGKLLRADPHATTFVVNSSKLTEPQQQYFGHLNKILSLIGATPKEFDDAFRLAVEHHHMLLIATTESHLRREFGGPSKFQNFDHIGKLKRFESADYKFKLKAGKRKLVESEVGKDLKTGEKSTSIYSVTLDNCFGIINTVLPNNPTNIEKIVFEQNALIDLFKEEKQLFFSAEENILQLYAQGANDLAVLRSISKRGKVAYAEYEDPSLDRIFMASVYNAAVGLVKRNGLSEKADQAVKQELTEMDKLKPQLFLTESELEAEHTAERERQTQVEARRAREAQAAAVLAQKQAAEAERRRLAAEEEAKKPKPYPSGLSGYDAPVAREIHAFCQLLDCRIPSHQRLGDTLLSPRILRVITLHIAGQLGQVKAFFNEEKNPEVAEELRRAQKAAEDLFKLKPEQIPDGQQEITGKINQSLLQSPIFLSFILGKENLIDEARQCHYDAGELGDDGAAYIKDHVHNMLSQHWPALAAIVIPPVALVPVNEVVASPKTEEPPLVVDKPIESVTPPPPPGDTPVVPHVGTEKEPPPANLIPPLLPVAAGAAALIDTPTPVTPSSTKQDIKPPVREPVSDTPPVDAVKIDVSPPPIVTATVAVPLVTVLQDDPGLPPAELDKRRAQAYQAMAKQLTMDAENAGLRALEDGYDQFRCDLLLDKTHARIRLLFKSEDGSKPPREEIFDLNSNQYIGGYARLGVVPTTLDALNLRIIVNGEITADGDFLPILSKTGSGKPRVGKNDFIPNLAIHADKRETRVNLNNNGMYQLELTSKFTKNGDDVTITFPLGIKEDRTDDTKAADARAIAEARGKIVTDFIDNYNEKTAKHRKIPIKGEIQEHLETEVLNIRNVNTTDPRGQWAYSDRIELLVSDGLQHHYLKLVDPLYEASVKTAKHDPTAKQERKEARDAIPRVVVYDDEWKESLAKAGEHQYREVKISIATLDEHPSKDQQQVTTLGAIALNKKGSNRTYHLDFNLHVNDGTAKTKRREHTAGYNIRGRSLNLCIEDPEIARSRAQEVLFGNDIALGFVDLVSCYFHQRPQARWALNAVQKGDDEITKKRLADNLEKEAKAVLGDDPVRAYRQMIKDELPISNLKRHLNIVRDNPQHGMVTIRAQIEERQPDKSYTLAKGAGDKDLEIVFSVSEKQAELVEHFARGDMDGVRLDVLINDLIPRFEHDLSVKVDQGEVKEGKVPVTFSVMRGRRDGKPEQHLDRQGRPARMRLLVPEEQKAYIASADPEKDALAETVDKHVGLLSAIHYSPITPAKPFGDALRYQELQTQYEQAKKDGDGFIDQMHPDFNPDQPKRWLEHAVTSNMRYHLPDISDVQVLREVRNGYGGGGNGYGKPNGVRERFPSALQDALREGSLYPTDQFLDRIDKELRTGRRI